MAKKTITSDDILGKDAIDPEGEILGVLTKMHIDKTQKKLTGVTIDQGFMKPDIFIGIRYIKNFGVDAVFLNKVPSTKFKGLPILTNKGKLVGKVHDVKSKRHKLEEIYLKKKGINYMIPASDIDEIGETIVLKQGCKPKKTKE